MFQRLLVVFCLTVLAVVLPRSLHGRNQAPLIRLGVGSQRSPLTPFLPSGEEKPWFLDSPADQRTAPGLCSPWLWSRYSLAFGVLERARAPLPQPFQREQIRLKRRAGRSR